jgi:hypothetical protein
MLYYHVAGPNYKPGDPLLCADRLKDVDIDPGPWKWNEAPRGWDSDVVCLYSTLEEAIDHFDTYGGSCILAVDVPDEQELGLYPLPWGGYIHPKVTTNDEGYTCIKDGIPSNWLSLVRLQQG